MFVIRIGEDEEHEFDFADPDNQELVHLERLYDGTFGEWLEAFGKKGITAQTALICLCRRRANPHIKMRDVLYKVKDFKVVNLDAQGEEVEPTEVDPDADPTDTPGDTESASGSTTSDDGI